MNDLPRPANTRNRTSKTFKDPSQTKQSFRAGSTVDSILKKYSQITGDNVALQQDIFAAGLAKAPYGIQRAHDYQQELNNVIRVREYFERLPSTTRDKFANDPLRMLTWLADPRNAEEAKKLKLLPSDENAAQGASKAPPAEPPKEPPSPPTKTA